MKEYGDYSTICRICLQDTDGEMFSLLDKDEDGAYCYFEKIEKCTNIKIIDEPDMPMKICAKCRVFLTFAFKFYIMCHNSQNYLQEFGLKTIKTEITDLQDSQEAEFSDYDDLIEEEEEDQDEGLLNEENYWFENILPDNSIDNSNTNSDIVTKNDEKKEEPPKKKLQNTKKDKQVEKTLAIRSDGAPLIRIKRVIKKELNKNQSHICDICGNIYPKKWAMEAHMRLHRNERLYECEICGTRFNFMFQLSRHMNKHTGARPFTCSYCARTFTDRSTMNKHERLHRNERPYKCDTCGKTFTYSSVLKAHIQVHTGEKPYNCGICGKRFTRSHHLRAHLETQQHSRDPRVKVLLTQIRPDAAVLKEQDSEFIEEEIGEA